MGNSSLRREIERIADGAGAEAAAVAVHDYRTRTDWSYNGEEWFHAASTIKVPVLVGVWSAIAEGRFDAEARVHVRNRFLSAAGGEPFRVDAARDANADVHRAIGKTMHVRELARHMIVTSGNLATNVLIELVGVQDMQAALEDLGLEGIRLRRGVEDERAFDAGINNEVTAHGLRGLFRLLVEGKALSREACDEMLDILHDQEFNRGIPAGLPDSARVAHKTGEISTVAHDAGAIYLEGRDPFVLAVLTRWAAADDAAARKEAIARMSRAVYEHLIEPEDDDGRG